jgi:hypothetical protein
MDLLNYLGYHEKWHKGVQNNRKKMKYSINEEIINKILDTINIKKGFFLEFGAWDGIVLSNTRHLFDLGWKGMYIEGDKEKYKQLENNYKDTNIILENIYLNNTDKNIEKILDKHNIKHIDYCSIDVDGIDLNLFETFKNVLPTVICIEGGQVLFPLDKNYVSIDIQKDNVTQSLYNYNKVFVDKGYILLCAYQDIFFVKKEFSYLFNPYNINDNLIEHYFNGLRHLPRIPWLYEKIKQYNIKNDIITDIINVTNNKNIKNRNLWLNDNSKTLKKTLQDLNNKYNILI